MGNSCFGEEDPSLLNDPLLGGALPVAERLSVDGKRGGSLSGDGSVGNPVIAERLSNEILYSSKKGERVVKQERFENGDVYNGDYKVDPQTLMPMKHGEGTYQYANGSVFVGEYFKDLMFKGKFKLVTKAIDEESGKPYVNMAVVLFCWYLM